MPHRPEKSHANLIIRLLSVVVLAFAALFPPPISTLVRISSAQEIRERRSIIDFLFRGRRPEPIRRKQIIQPTPSVVPIKKNPAKQRPARSSIVTTNAALGTPKAPDARKVLVIGDFMASALADGLEIAFLEDAGIVIEKETDGSSGLVRVDHLDWPKNLQEQIAKFKPALIVIMLGSNDRQQMSVDGVKEKFGSDAWNAEYDKRVRSLINVAINSKSPLIWTGLPSFQSPSLSADAATLNSLYRSKTEMAGGVFIDIWDGFADENGKFIASGSDINGQPVRLRGSDGLSLTKAGKRKMAFYLEKDLRRLLGADDVGKLVRLNSGDLPLESSVGTATLNNILTVAPVSLSDPELDGSSALLDTGVMPASGSRTPRDLLIEKGETGDAPEGRVDNFVWKPAAKTPG